MRTDLAFVILNYRSPELTAALAQHLHAFGYGASIFLVDNASGDDSPAQLQALSVQLGCPLILNPTNAGYAAGNNLGLAAAHKAGYRYALILNNDIEVGTDADLDALCEAADADPKAGCICPRIVSPAGKEAAQRIDRPSAWDMSLGIFAFEKKQKAKSNAANGNFPIYRAHGCCMMLRLDIAEQVGYLDPHTFLYFEESIFAERLLAAGFHCLCAGQVLVVHNHSVVTKKALTVFRMMKIFAASGNYYMKHYRHFAALPRWAAVVVKSLAAARAR